MKRVVVKYQNIFVFLVSLILAVGVGEFFGLSLTREYLLALLLFVAVFCMVRFGVRAFNKRRLGYSLAYSVPFSLAYWFGRKVVYQSTEIEPMVLKDFFLIVILISIFTLGCLCVLAFIDKKQFIPKKKIKSKSKKDWLLYSLIIFLCWIPLFLAFFPGLISVDSAVQIRQAIGEGAMSNWHPVLHTLFVALPANIGVGLSGDLTMGIALSSLLQMLILGLIFGYTVKWVKNKTEKRWVYYLFLVFFAVCPVVACYAITMWKDILFSAVFMLLVMKLYDLLIGYKRDNKLKLRGIVLIILLSILVAFLRNGGILIVVVLGVALFIYYKKSRKIIGVCFALVIVATLLIQGPIYKALNIASSPFMESMSVPAQQIGYVAYTGALSDKEKVELSPFVNVDKLSESYSPMNADPAKNSFDYQAVEEDKGKFLGAWWHTLTSHFGAFVKAYILQMYAYWNIQSDAWVLDLEHTHDSVWLETEYSDLSLIGGQAKEFLRKLELGLTKSVWIGWMSSVGVLFWGVGFMMMVFLYQRRYRMLVPMSCVFGYMASLLIASPVSWIFRYVYSLLLIIPILIVICFLKEERRRK